MKLRSNALLVDDDPHLLRSMKAVLHSKRKQWNVQYAEDGKAALQCLDRHQFQLVVSDMRMPGMSGCDVLNEVSLRQPQAVRVLLSGETGRKAPTEIMGLAHQFICKPCDTDVLLGLFDLTSELATMIPSPRLRRALSSFSCFPMDSEMHSSIFKELFSESPSLKTLGGLVHQDMALSALILRTVNSPFFGATQSINNPEHAVCYLGLDIVQGLLLGHCAFSRFRCQSNALFNISKLWSHSLQTAQLAKQIANYEGVDKTTRNEIFTAAMLHDIGKLALMWVVRKQYPELAACALTQGIPLCAVEKEVFQCSHTEVGAYILGLWGFNRNVMLAVRDSHNLSNGIYTQLPIAAVVQAADAFAWKSSMKQSDKNDWFIQQDWFYQHGLSAKLTEWEAVCSNALS